MERKELNTIIALAVVIGFFSGAVGGGLSGFVLYRVLSLQRAQFLQPGFVRRMIPQNAAVWSSSEAAAPDSLEGKLRAEGKHWVRTTGEITEGAYVKDNLEGRLGQPKGRGAVGKVVSISSNANGRRAASVDFGRGYVPGIDLSELSLVQVLP